MAGGVRLTPEKGVAEQQFPATVTDWMERDMEKREEDRDIRMEVFVVAFALIVAATVCIYVISLAL